MNNGSILISTEVCKALAVILQKTYSLREVDTEFVNTLHFKLGLSVDVKHLEIPWFDPYRYLDIIHTKDVDIKHTVLRSKFFVCNVDSSSNTITEIKINPILLDAVRAIDEIYHLKVIEELIDLMMTTIGFQKSLEERWASKKSYRPN